MIKNLIRQTQKVVRDTLKKFQKPAIACSFGLDSMLSLYFCRQIIPDIPVIWVDSGCEYPDTYRFIKKIVPTEKINLVKILAKHTFLWVVGRHGFPLYSRGNMAKYNKKYLPAHYCCLYLKRRPLQQHIRNTGYDIIVDGMRVDESQMRRYWITKRGICHYSKDNRSYRFHPVAYWTRDQEEEATKILKIPLNTIYKKKLEGCIARTGCWCCTMNWDRGNRSKYLRKYYPQLWRILMINYGFAKFLLKQRLNTEIPNEKIEDILETRPCFFDTVQENNNKR